MARTCTLRGKTLTLEGPELKVGDKAPDATLLKDLFTEVHIRDTTGRVRIFNVVPSLDTSVCAVQTRRFHEEVQRLENVIVYTVSCDLPPAQARFCGSEGIDPERVVMLSDYRDVSFGRAWGTLIPQLRLECRAVFVVDPQDVLRHVQYVPEIADEPDYEAALSAARACLNP